MSDISHKMVLIEALEQALADARSGRLSAFAFAGIGHGEHVLSYSFDDLKPDDWFYLIGAVDKVRSAIIGPSVPVGMETSGSPIAEVFEFVRSFSQRDPAFAKGSDNDRIAKAKLLMSMFPGAAQ